MLSTGTTAAPHTEGDGAEATAADHDAPAKALRLTVRLDAARAHLREPLFRNAYALMLSTVATGAVGIGFWALAARKYDTEVVGQNAALISAMMIVSTFAQLDLAAMLLRFLPRWRAQAGRAVLICYGVATVAAVALAAGFVAVVSHLPGNLAFLESPGIAASFCLAVAAWGIFAIQDGALTGLGRAPVVPVENTTFGVAKLALLACLLSSWSRWGIFLAWTVPVVLSLLPINLLIFRRYLPAHRLRPVHPDPLDRGTITRYVAFDYAGSLCGALTTMAIPVMVIAMLGADAAAHFYVAWTVVLIVDTVALSLGTSLVVEGSYDPRQLAMLTRRVLRRGLLLVLPTMLGVALLAPLLLSVFGHDYSEASTMTLRILVIGIIPRSVIIVYTAMARVQGAVSHVLGVVIVVTFLIVVGVVAFGEHFGLVGVAAGWVLGYTVVAAAIAPRLWRAIHPIAAPADVEAPDVLEQAALDCA